MSSIDFVEVAREGELPVVAMRHASVQEVEAADPLHIARLRFFSLQAHQAAWFTWSRTMCILALIGRLAEPDSELRSLLMHSGRYSHEPFSLFLQAKGSDKCHFEPLHVHSWSDFASHKPSVRDHGLFISVEGNRNDLLKLLDSIGREEKETCSAERVRLAGATPSLKADAHQEAIAFRDELLSRNWPDGRRVAEMAGAGSSSNPHQYAARRRAKGSLLGVWVAAERTFRHPDFQFDEHGAIRDVVSELLKVLPNDAEDHNGWRRAFWIYSPHSLLRGRTPAEVFEHDPRRVIEVAREEFSGDSNEHW